jgi:PIN domain nuclease of toxin-antitoxin system
MIKSMKGKLDVGDPKGWWALSIQKLVATSLSLTPRHVEFFQGLPSIHSDPFDRILVAQAMAENLTLVTLDTGIASYATKKLRVVC